jgi:hypothetical protein
LDRASADFRNRSTLEEEFASGRPLKADYQSGKRRFARPRLAYHTDGFSSLYGEVYPVHCVDLATTTRAASHFELATNVLEFQQWQRGTPSRCHSVPAA